MVDWHDPAVITEDEYSLVKFVHFLGGVYIWEFILYFGFEYVVIVRRRKFTWSFLLYLGCRWSCLLTLTIQMLGFDTSHKINCQSWIISAFLFGNLSSTFASSLIVLRVAAIWDRNKYIVTFACVILLSNIASIAYSISPLRSVWIGDSCEISHTNHGKVNVLSTFVTDIILLVLMLVGLVRWRNASCSSGVWRLLRTQCLIWVVIVNLAGVPATVFVSLDLNSPLNMIAQTLAVVIASLGAARIHRGLVDYPALNASVRTPHASEWASELNRKRLSAQSCPINRTHDIGDVEVVLDAPPVTMCCTEVHKAESSENGNIV